MSEHTYDFIGIGAGPFNLGLAALSAPVPHLDGLILEASESFDWHPGMMLDSAHLQVPFMADLVTMADPTSPFSFLNFLKCTNRLYPFYIREDFYPLRAEFNRYCQWVAARLSSVCFGERVTAVTHENGRYAVRSRATGTDGVPVETVRHARRLVLGTGTEPSVPASCAGLPDAGGLALHSAEYLHRRDELRALRSITVVGSGQSAAEVYRDLLETIDEYGYELTWVTRSPRFFPLEYTKLTLEMTSPEYVDYFHALPAGRRDAVIGRQGNLYKGIDSDLINEIYDLLYAKSVEGPPNTRLLTHSAVTGAAFDAGTGLHRLDLHHGEQDRDYRLHTEAVVMATGYGYREPEFLAGIEHRIRRDDRGRFDVGRDYGISAVPGEIYVQNAELHTHGFVTPDLGMGSYRNASIIREMIGFDYYPVEESIAFQQFGAPPEFGPEEAAAGHAAVPEPAATTAAPEYATAPAGGTR